MAKTQSPIPVTAAIVLANADDEQAKQKIEKKTYGGSYHETALSAAYGMTKQEAENKVAEIDQIRAAEPSVSPVKISART